MIRKSIRRAIVVRAIAALSLIGFRPVSAQTMYGALSNFDVFNDTGQETHGFEIELDGLTSADVPYTFGDPYERYGNPKLVDFPGGVYVRYESAYDAANQVFLQATPTAPAVITPTDGHFCFNGGNPAYLTSGCEHFGIGTNANPTNVVYRWLVADPASPGALQPAGTKVSIPAPIFNVSPPPPASPNPAPVVAAVIQAPAPQGYEFGDAQWVKVYKTESPNAADLDHLVTDDPAVPQEQAEVETEWYLLQASVNGNANGELANEAQMGEGMESVTRRYEFYEYTGAYDPETHEARPVNDTNPDPADVGNYVGAQMAAVNVAPAPQPPPPPLVVAGGALPGGEVGMAYAASLVSGGVPPYSVRLTGGSLPSALSIDPGQGLLSGVPAAGSAAPFQFTVEASDAASQVVSASFQLPIANPLIITTQSLPRAKHRRAYGATLTAADGRPAYGWWIASGSLPSGLSLDTASGVISGVTGRKERRTFTVAVTDSLGAQAQKILTIVVK